MGGLRQFALRFNNAFAKYLADELEIKRQRFEQLKAFHMANYGLTSDQFDQLLELERIRPGIYESVTNEIARQQLEKVKDQLKDFTLPVHDQGIKPHVIRPKRKRSKL
jgi:hypothetical protein